MVLRSRSRREQDKVDRALNRTLNKISEETVWTPRSREIFEEIKGSRSKPLTSHELTNSFRSGMSHSSDESQDDSATERVRDILAKLRVKRGEPKHGAELSFDSESDALSLVYSSGSESSLDLEVDRSRDSSESSRIPVETRKQALAKEEVEISHRFVPVDCLASDQKSKSKMPTKKKMKKHKKKAPATSAREMYRPPPVTLSSHFRRNENPSTTKKNPKKHKEGLSRTSLTTLSADNSAHTARRSILTQMLTSIAELQDTASRDLPSACSAYSKANVSLATSFRALKNLRDADQRHSPVLEKDRYHSPDSIRRRGSSPTSVRDLVDISGSTSSSGSFIGFDDIKSMAEMAFPLLSDEQTMGALDGHLKTWKRKNHTGKPSFSEFTTEEMSVLSQMTQFEWTQFGDDDKSVVTIWGSAGSDSIAPMDDLSLCSLSLTEQNSLEETGTLSKADCEALNLEDRFAGGHYCIYFHSLQSASQCETISKNHKYNSLQPNAVERCSGGLYLMAVRTKLANI